VGQSEANIRALFAEAEAEYETKGDESDLHLIILDELDAITRARGHSAPPNLPSRAPSLWARHETGG